MERERFTKCRVCGCTPRVPCEPPCKWIEPELCSTCANAADALAKWIVAAPRANRTALWIEAVALAEGR